LLLLFLLLCCCFCCFDLALVDMVFSLKLENEGKKMEIQWRWWTLGLVVMFDEWLTLTVSLSPRRCCCYYLSFSFSLLVMSLISP